MSTVQSPQPTIARDRIFRPRHRRGLRRASARWAAGLAVLLVLWPPAPDASGDRPGLGASAQAFGSRGRDPGPAGRIAMASDALEREGYMIRPDAWQSKIEPEVGKAVRVQLFKGHSYSILALPVTGAEGAVEANVIDGTGRPVEQRNRNWRGASRLDFTPDATGLYLILVRNTTGQEITGAVVIGYK